MLSLYKVKCKFECRINKKENREFYSYIFASSEANAKKLVSDLEAFDEDEGRCFVVSCEFLRKINQKEIKDGVTEGVGGSSWDV